MLTGSAYRETLVVMVVPSSFVFLILTFREPPDRRFRRRKSKFRRIVALLLLSLSTGAFAHDAATAQKIEAMLASKTVDKVLVRRLLDNDPPTTKVEGRSFTHSQVDFESLAKLVLSADDSVLLKAYVAMIIRQMPESANESLNIGMARIYSGRTSAVLELMATYQGSDQSDLVDSVAYGLVYLYNADLKVVKADEVGRLIIERDANVLPKNYKHAALRDRVLAAVLANFKP